ncbi:hypothetical protein PDIDSM_66760 [Penicillium digitatum]|nr:hypothetical protein PDIDSM_66760 [Penicillium digitatum]
MSVLGTFNTNFAGIQDAQESHVANMEARRHDPTASVNTEDTANEKSEVGDEKYTDAEVTRLAQQLTRQSTRFSVSPQNAENPFIETHEDSTLNPHSGNFKAKNWMKNLLAIQSRDPERYPKRQAGLAFKNLSVHGFGSPTDYQKDVANSVLEIGAFFRTMAGTGKQKIQILRDFDGLVKNGEMLIVLGRPGSGCSTFLKTIAGEMNGIFKDANSHMNYQGISDKEMRNQFRGEAIYTAETDVHFPQLSVGNTLKFAALARAPRNRLPGVSRDQYAEHMRDVVMAMLGLSHTINTRVGNDFIRGVSGGERKRVSIAEATLCGSPLQCWDNSTRGLDSANALEFCKTLNLMSKYSGTTCAVAIYQASQSAYDVFDKVTVLAAYKELQKEIDDYNTQYPIGGESFQQFVESRKAMQSKGQRAKSPYTLSVAEQVQICVTRGFQRLKSDYSLTISALIGNTIMALIVGSVFYQLPDDVTSFYSRGALLFFAVLLNSFSSALEILTLYAQRPIVEKQARYAMYHPFAEAISSMLCDMPYKILNAITFNVTLYFMTGLRQNAGAFFTFMLFSFVTTLTMSMIFRTIASYSRTLSQALVPAAILILGLVIYTGFTIPTRNMLGWSRWMNYIDPIAYGFETLIVNEFHGRNFPCNPESFIPAGDSYADVGRFNKICSAKGAVAGQNFVSGEAYYTASFQYSNSHRWRNMGIMIGFMVFFMVTYLVGTEYISEAKSKGEVLLFRRGYAPKNSGNSDGDVEQTHGVSSAEKKDGAGSGGEQESAAIQRQTSIFQWQDVCYDVHIKNEERRILDHVDGWVKPGTCTALMGVSGAGKTTLLDVLATRVTMGVVSGEMLVDGRPRDQSFQRKTGYVQQQDLHLHTTTVREALRFSAILRQPRHVSHQEKLDYVEEVIKLLGMEHYADAVVGVPGEGLNVEQRKRLTIGVELAAKPQLLLFLDEPTSGLDSQTSWSILDLIDTLTKHGQAILCTIHQPSAMLFQRFDRLLFLAKGGRTVYFGEIGEHSSTLSNYFERNGAPKLSPEANPAEWMLEVIGAAPGTHSDIDWPAVWRESPERKAVQNHLAELRNNLSLKPVATTDNDPAGFNEFAAPFAVQLWQCLIRVFSQYWRTPIYIYSKTALCSLTALYVGFSFFHAQNSMQGLQNQMFSIFMLMTIFGNLVQQIMPHFVTQRSLYEVRERPSKTYSWQAFMSANILVELPWNALMSVLIFLCWYYPVGLQRNASADDLHERGALMWLLILTFMLFTSTFSHMMIAGIELAETGGNLANLLFSLCLIFCGVLATPDKMPHFWIFMYRVSPFTYLVSAMLSTGTSGAKVECESVELLHFEPTAGKTCFEYMNTYMNGLVVNGTQVAAPAGGYLVDNNATSNCAFCTIADTDTYLASVLSYYKDAWRNFGIMWAFIIFNIFGAVCIYWLARVPKGTRSKKTKTA